MTCRRFNQTQTTSLYASAWAMCNAKKKKFQPWNWQLGSPPVYRVMPFVYFSFYDISSKGVCLLSYRIKPEGHLLRSTSNEQVHQYNNLMEELFSCFETEKVHIIAIISSSPHPAMPEPLMPSSCAFYRCWDQLKSSEQLSSETVRDNVCWRVAGTRWRQREISLPMDIQRRQPSQQLVCLRLSGLN